MEKYSIYLNISTNNFILQKQRCYRYLQQLFLQIGKCSIYSWLGLRWTGMQRCTTWQWFVASLFYTPLSLYVPETREILEFKNFLKLEIFCFLFFLKFLLKFQNIKNFKIEKKIKF